MILTALAALTFLVPSFTEILTLGLGSLLPTIWLYATALAPAVCMIAVGLNKYAGYFVGFAAVAALAIVPARVAKTMAIQIQEALIANDFEKPLPQMPQDIELVHDSIETSRESLAPLRDAACGHICQRLLITNQVKSVTVKSLKDKTLSPTVVTYTVERHRVCPYEIGLPQQLLQMTRDSHRSGICIIPSDLPLKFHPAAFRV